MAIAKKDRFVHSDIKRLVKMNEEFPPENFNYNELVLTVLGRSNKDDLFPASVNDIELQKAMTYGKMEQLICVSEQGDMYDACLYQLDNSIFLYAIRTREVR